MVQYICLRCGYTTHIKTIFVRHLLRKKICEPILKDITIPQIFDYYCLDNKVKTKAKTKSKYICSSCGKEYSSYNSKWRHEKYNCKNKNHDENNMKQLVYLLNEQLQETKKHLDKRDEQIDKQLTETKSQLDKRDKQIESLVKKTGFNITNTQNNIKLLSYGNTDISHLTENDYINCLNHSNFCIPHLIKKIHFNPNKPENHNIYISNIKNCYVMLYDGRKWNLQNRDEAIINLIDDKEMIIEQKLEEWIENGKNYPDIMTKFNKYLEIRENDEILDNIKEEIKITLYNNRSLLQVKS